MVPYLRCESCSPEETVCGGACLLHLLGAGPLNQMFIFPECNMSLCHVNSFPVLQLSIIKPSSGWSLSQTAMTKSSWRPACNIIMFIPIPSWVLVNMFSLPLPCPVTFVILSILLLVLLVNYQLSTLKRLAEVRDMTWHSTIINHHQHCARNGWFWTVGIKRPKIRLLARLSQPNLHTL